MGTSRLSEDMINWDATTKLSGATCENYKRGDGIVVQCDYCGTESQIKLQKRSLINGGQYKHRCRSCATKAMWSNQQYRDKIVANSKDLWLDNDLKEQMLTSRRSEEYRENQRIKAIARYEDVKYLKRVTIANRTNLKKPSVRKKLAESTTRLWTNPDYRDKMISIIKRNANDPVVLQKISESMQHVWENEEYRSKLIPQIAANSIELWKNETYRNSIIEGVRLALCDPNVRAKMSKGSKERWDDQISREAIMDGIKSCWANEEFRSKMVDAIRARWANEEFRSKMVDAARARWSDEVIGPRLHAARTKMINSPEVRAKLSTSSRKLWENNEYREKVKSGKVSSLQVTLYSLLDDLGVCYYREYENQPDDVQCHIGPYSFDCVIPREGKRDLLLECQGDYWHGTSAAQSRDISKSSYISNNLSHKYELRAIWEHEFKNHRKILDLLRYWLGVQSIPLVDFNFSDLVINTCDPDDCRLLLSKYHYLQNAGRGGQRYGAYHNGKLVALAVFSPPIRQNYDHKIVRELSRFCIHPAYQKKNLASWFLSKCLKKLPIQYRKIISFSDTTYGHSGIIYQASNFKLDGEVKPDYWYISTDGWVMHKKTLYNHAVNLKMKEAIYASTYGYSKVYGLKKLRYIYDR